jgi:hypothetical protein
VIGIEKPVIVPKTEQEQHARIRQPRSEPTQIVKGNNAHGLRKPGNEHGLGQVRFLPLLLYVHLPWYAQARVAVIIGKVVLSETSAMCEKTTADNCIVSGCTLRTVLRLCSMGSVEIPPRRNHHADSLVANIAATQFAVQIPPIPVKSLLRQDSRPYQAGI